VTSRTWDYIAGTCIVVALAFVLAVAGPLLGIDWRRALLPLGLILFLAVGVPLLLRGLAVLLSQLRQTTAGGNQPDSRLMFARSKRAARILAVAVGLVFLLEIVLGMIVGAPTVASKAAVSNVAGEPSRTVSIFFVGNSFTYVNDMPGMLLQVASSDASNKVRLEVRSLTRGGATLNYLFHNIRPSNVLTQQHWDYVVLQEQSEWTGSQERITETYSAVNQWNQAVRQIGAKPVLYETWADKAGSPTYTDKDSYFFRQSSDRVQENIDAQSSALAGHFDMSLVPAGRYWAYAEKQSKAPELFAADYHHPSVAGSFLTALIFYRFFTGNAPTRVTYRPPELTPDQAQFLIDVACLQIGARSAGAADGPGSPLAYSADKRGSHCLP